MSGPGPIARGDVFRLIRERLESQGAAMWRTNPAGTVIEEPSQDGLAGLWLSSPELASRIGRAVGSWDGQPPVEPEQVIPGAWLVGVPERFRRRVTAYTVGLLLGPGAIEGETFESLCAAARVDPGTTRHVLRPLATFDRESASRTLGAIRWMVEDASRIAEDEETIAGFTAQLSSAYETIDLLYALGYAMRELNEPERFVSLALDRLHETLEFAWIAVVFTDRHESLSRLNGRSFVSGEPTMLRDRLDEACRSLVSEIEPGIDRRILSGVEGFEPDGGPQVVTQPVQAGGVTAAVLLAGEKRGIDPQVSSYDTHLLEAMAGYLGPFLDNVMLYEQQQRMSIGTIRALSAAIDAKDRYTCGHSARVAHLGASLARAVGLDEGLAERIHIAGLVHDVGKIGVPEAVLCKAGRLTDEEFDLIKRHPQIGHDILKDIPLLRDVLPGVLEHHERWDGRGYPRGLAGESISMMGRILALADTFDAMSSTRSYRPGMARQHVLEEIERCAGTQFDPELVPAFLSLDFSRFDEMVAQAERDTGHIARAA